MCRTLGHAWFVVPLMKAFAGHAPEYPSLYLVFPTRQRVEAMLPPGMCSMPFIVCFVARHGRQLYMYNAGLGFLCFTETNWPEPAKWYLRHLRPACSNRQGVIEHTKLFVREVTLSTDPRAERCVLTHAAHCAMQGTDGLGYVYVGSHNLSSFAWGQTGKRAGQPIVTYRNYEVGVLLCPVRCVVAMRAMPSTPP